MLRQFHTLLDYHADMALLMRLVKSCITGDNLFFHIVDNILRNRFQFQFRYFASISLLLQYLPTVRTFLHHTLFAYVAGMTFAGEFFVSEILTALPTIMAHWLFELFKVMLFIKRYTLVPTLWGQRSAGLTSSSRAIDIAFGALGSKQKAS